MKISKKSWHYKLLKSMNSYPKDNLCPYVRQVIGNMLLCLLLFSLLLGAAFLASYPIWRWWLQDGTTGFFSSCLWIVGGAIMIKVYHEEWKISAYYLEHPRFDREGMLDMTKWYHRQLIPQAVQNLDIHLPRPAHDNIFLERARAAHDKVCPQLEFKQ